MKKFKDLAGEGKDLRELNTLENYVKIIRLMRKGLTVGYVAKHLNYLAQDIRAFIGKVNNDKNYFLQVQFEAEYERQAAAEDYVKAKTTGETPPGEEPGRKFIDLLILRNDLRKGLTNKQIAELFQADEKSFNQFMEKNQKYLDLLS